MAKISKRRAELLKKLDLQKTYALADGVAAVL
jgi:hypothetical protein